MCRSWRCLTAAFINNLNTPVFISSSPRNPPLPLSSSLLFSLFSPLSLLSRRSSDYNELS